MSNEFYTYGDTLIGGTTANAEDVGAEFNALVTAFDKLPTEAQLKSGQLNYVVDTGAANAYVVALPHTILSYAAGLTLTFKATNTNTGASTLNVDSVGVIPIVKTDGAALDAGDIQAGALVTVTYDGSNFQAVGSLQGVIAAAEAARDAALAAKTAAETAQTNAETAETNAETAEANAATEVTYAAEWADKAEDSAVSVAAGGDGSTTFSAKHWSAKAEDWAQTVNIPSVAGQSGKFLSNDGTNKSWEAISNTYELISSTTVSGSPTAIDFTLPSGYESYHFYISGLSYTGSNTYYLYFSQNGGSTWDNSASDYTASNLWSASNISTVQVDYGSTFSYAQIAKGSANVINGGILRLYGCQVGTNTSMEGSVLSYGGGTLNHYRCSVIRSSTVVTNAVRFYVSGGVAFDSGHIKLYGVKNA